MEENLKLILTNQFQLLKELLGLLDKQHEYLCYRKAFELDKVVRDIEQKSKELAKYEMDRRNLVQGNSIVNIIKESKDNKLREIHEECIVLLDQIRIQKDTNEFLIRQGISLTTSVLTILNPDKTPKTYGPQGRR